MTSHSSEAEKYKIEVSAESLPGERLSSWLSDTTFLIHSHTGGVGKEGWGSDLSSSFYKNTIPIMGDPTLMTSFKHNFPKTPP